jgi:hypothetical protein
MMRHKMYEKTFKFAKKMTNGNDVTHNTKHTNLINKTKFTPYSVPPAHAPASVISRRPSSDKFCAAASIVKPHSIYVYLGLGPI